MTQSYVIIKKEHFKPIIDKIKSLTTYTKDYNKQFVERMCDINVRSYIFGIPIGRKVSLYLRSYEKALKRFNRVNDSIIIRNYSNFNDYVYIGCHYERMLSPIIDALYSAIEYNSDTVSVSSELLNILECLEVDVKIHRTAVGENNGKN